MSNPARAPKEYTSDQLFLASSPDSFLPEAFRDAAKSYKKLDNLTAALGALDMEIAASIVVPKEHTVAASVLQKNGPALALSTLGVPEPRLRSSFAKSVVNRAFGQLPTSGFLSQAEVGDKMRKVVYVSGGTECTVGRLLSAYPRRGVRPSRPVLKAEAMQGLVSCGLTMRHLPAHALRPYPLIPVEGEVGVTVNPNSDNGFPVLGKWNTPDAAAKCMALAVTVEREIRELGNGETWLREQEKRRPWLVAVRGKAKADYYPQEKVVEGRMRFYNALPRQVMLNMQKATQVLELNARSILQDSDSHSGIGITLVRRGAEELVGALDAQLRRESSAFVHVGDDSWVVLRDGENLVLFALDCSNFDLTQHGTVTQEVHEAIRGELALVDARAAELWYGYARERLVVVSGAAVYRWKHAGPSGMPLQSKVNDVLMDIMIRRLLQALPETITEESMNSVIADVGKAMGFTVRVEQYWSGAASSVLEALEQTPFLFIGYYFHVRGGQVAACADIPRTFAQVPFPALKWAKSMRDLQVTEAMRLGSIALNLGIPPATHDASFKAFREAAMALVEQVLDQHGDQRDPRLRWAVSESPWGSEVEASLSGLLKAVRRDPRVLWLYKEPELPGISTLLTVEGAAWADLVEEDEAVEAAELGATTVRPAGLRAKAAVLTRGVVPTHPASIANVGRPPPTAVWGPNKEPRVAGATAGPSRRARRRDGIAAREYEAFLEDQYFESEDDDAWEDYQ